MKKGRINILGVEHSIEYPGDQRTMGYPARIMHDKHIIQIATDQLPEEEISSLIHEVLESLEHLLELELSHATITRLEVGLYQVLTQNGVDLTPLLEEVSDGKV